jgi:VacB/RNase II family 3'-5' exoribonuclease
MTSLTSITEQVMRDVGFSVGFPPRIHAELSAITAKAPEILAESTARDLRGLLWSSIDDGKTRDLDQVEYADAISADDVRLLIAIADVDGFVRRASEIDKHAAANCTSVYTGIKTFHMLPDELSTDLTSLKREVDRLAVVTELIVGSDGSVKSVEIYQAKVRNRAKLAYEEIGPWLDGKSDVPASISSMPGLEEQIRLQDVVAERLRDFRKRAGALELGTIQAVPVVGTRGELIDLKQIGVNAARDLIANLMISANVAMAQFLEQRGVPSLRRVVREPEQWDRIVEIAAKLNEKLPPKPDSLALAEFLDRRKKADPLHFPDLSLAVVKSLGPGEYEVQGPNEQAPGHFGLAVEDYTHSTAPNRRYSDLITQRLVKAAINGQAPPYSVEELREIAQRCTEREDAARKVERKIRKVVAAHLLHDKVNQEFKAIVTGTTPKGTFARLINPPVDGRIVKGERGLRVGDKTRVRLLSTDPKRGFIDFAAL